MSTLIPRSPQNSPVHWLGSATGGDRPQDRRPRRASRPRHHLPTGRGHGHRHHGLRYPNCNPPPSSATVMCVTAILTETERKRPDGSVHRAEERRCLAKMMRVCGPTCPHSSVQTHASPAQDAKHLISKRIQVILASSGMPLGKVGLGSV